MASSSGTRRAVLAVLVAGVGLIHLLDLPGKWEETRWMGVAYLGLIAASVVTAELLLRADHVLGYLAAAAVSAGPLTGFVLTRTVGLPGARDDIGNWGEPLGLASLFTEALVLLLAASGALAPGYAASAAEGTHGRRRATAPAETVPGQREPRRTAAQQA